MTRLPEHKIAIDIRRKRIRLNKSIFTVLNYPEYIQLLVNPETRSIVVMASTKTKDSTKVQGNLTKGFEMTSLGLIRSLQKLCPDWTDDNNYHILGAYVESADVVEFDMKDAVPYSRTGVSTNG